MGIHQSLIRGNSGRSAGHFFWIVMNTLEDLSQI